MRQLGPYCQELLGRYFLRIDNANGNIYYTSRYPRNFRHNGAWVCVCVCVCVCVAGGDIPIPGVNVQVSLMTILRGTWNIVSTGNESLICKSFSHKNSYKNLKKVRFGRLGSWTRIEIQIFDSPLNALNTSLCLSGTKSRYTVVHHN